METQDKQKLLGDLYTLKFGMTLVSMERDKIENLLNEFESVKNKAIVDNLYYSDYAKGKDFTNKKDVDSFIDKMNGELDSIHRRRKYRINKNIASFVVPIIAMLITIGVTILGVYLITITHNLTFEQFGIFFYLIVLAPYLIAIIGAVGFIISLVYLIHNKYRDFACLDNLAEAARKAERDIKVVQELSKRLMEMDKEVEARVLQIIKKSNQLIAILINQFNPIIDFRDWQYLDLIVYYLQTKRADTLKEALQQVDRQIQTDSIVNAVENATKEICQTVRLGIQTYGRQITSRFEIIISQNQSKTSRESFSISQSDMQNALQLQSSRSAEYLVDDVSYFRENLKEIN